MKLVRATLLFAAMTLVSSCGEKLDTSVGQRADVAADGKQKPVALIPPGSSGMIPTTPGFSELDQAKLAAASSDATSLCAVDKAYVVKEQPTTTFRTSDTITLSGWILNPKRQAPESFALLLVGESRSYAIQGRAGKNRRDVARVHKSRAAKLSGFQISAELAGVAPGEYGISLVQDTNDKLTTCTTKRRITISG